MPEVKLAQPVGGFRYVPRQGGGVPGGCLKDPRICIGVGLVKK